MLEEKLNRTNLNKIWTEDKSLQEKYDHWTESIVEILTQCGKRKRKKRYRSKQLRKLTQLHKSLKKELRKKEKKRVKKEDNWKEIKR